MNEYYGLSLTQIYMIMYSGLNDFRIRKAGNRYFATDLTLPSTSDRIVAEDFRELLDELKRRREIP